MLPSTVRRIATVAPQCPLLSACTPLAPRATAALALHSNPRCTQRRRYSSSKPSGPNDSLKGLSADQVSASPAQSSKHGGEKRKRKTKESSAIGKLPSVPSTQDVPQEALASATFFSLHRPISVTHSFPKSISDDAFAQIFAPRTKPAQYNKVVSTLARTVDQLEQPMQGMSMAAQHENDVAVSHDTNGEPTQQISLRHADGTETSLYVQVDHMSGQFLPFHPPPLPQPQPSTEAQAESAVAEEEQHEPQTRIYKAIFTLEETIDESGNTRIVAHTPKLIEDGTEDVAGSPRSPLRPMIRRPYIRGQANRMYAISVKRQRKLKMKKQKYKKLMRRTRNERRKLDRV
ncbi:hypothetical protein F4808DRAFT_460369 [Astrocystis sublimbata]|nr:hypothetical protein F4808DRAFT_460369 [Astrocystis sublimbata]